MEHKGSYLYRVTFVYRQKTYSAEFFSTTKITPETEKSVAWDIADDAIKSVLATIPDRPQGVYPHSIVVSGEFGSITVKD